MRVYANNNSVAAGRDAIVHVHAEPCPRCGVRWIGQNATACQPCMSRIATDRAHAYIVTVVLGVAAPFVMVIALAQALFGVQLTLQDAGRVIGIGMVAGAFGWFSWLVWRAHRG